MLVSVRGAVLVTVLAGLTGAALAWLAVAGAAGGAALGAVMATLVVAVALVPLPPALRVRLLPLVATAGVLALVLVLRDWVVGRLI